MTPRTSSLLTLATCAGMLLSSACGSYAQAANPPAPEGRPAQPQRGGPRDGRLPKLPVAMTSFGAAVLDGSLYIYGGHIGKAHAHSRDNLAEGFWRLDLEKPREWETLPTSEKMQGFAMVAWRNSIIRVGGLTMRNAAGEPADMHSVAKVERFDPATKKWTELTPLPHPRSSLDAVVVGDKLYVIGGWALSGGDETGKWSEENYVADLSKEPLTWEPLPKAPFQHRALAVSAAGNHIVVLGGMNSEEAPRRDTYLLNTETNTWSKGPDLPTDNRMKAFGASAFVVGDRIWASAADGKVHSLKPGEPEWRNAQFTLNTPRFFHRLLPTARGTLLFIGGAGKGGHYDTIEQVELATLEAAPVTSLPAPSESATVKGQGQANWTGFRGDGNSRTNASNLPVRWSDTENLGWKAELIGTGQSSPVVWGDKVFVTSVDGPRKETLIVQCHSLASGEQLWAARHPSSSTKELSDYVSKAAPTPVVDGDRVYAFFESGDVIALDHAGNVVWQRSLSKEYGEFKGNHGLGSSLVQIPGAVVVLVDHDGPSYLLALDREKGANVWKTDRPARVSWSTPLVLEEDGKLEIVVSSAGSVDAYAAEDGRQLWSVGDLKGNTVPSPTAAGDLIVIGSSERNNTLAIRQEGSKATVAWKAPKASVSFGSPAVAGDSAYFVNKAGVLFCSDLATGSQRWSLRLPDSCWASPVVAGDLVFFFSKNGATTVLRNSGSGAEKVAESKLTVSGTVYGVAAVDGAWIVRTADRLLCIRSSKVAPLRD